MDILDDLYTTVCEDYSHIIEELSDNEWYNVKVLYVPSKDRLVLCVYTEIPYNKRYITIEEASSYYSYKELSTLEMFDYTDIIGRQT
jgi:hypothetical protein